jgi:hypothetical protein
MIAAIQSSRHAPLFLFPSRRPPQPDQYSARRRDEARAMYSAPKVETGLVFVGLS